MKATRPTRIRRPLLAALFAAALLLVPAPPALAGGGWSAVSWALGSQKRMLQVGTVGMCLALYIIMWRKLNSGQ
jgi:hypothetical protein